ncbi:uncharacterized protein SPSK_02892 [Sporothrix schenckii 1099-18]|uniref:Uncharacterized protein n=1 Tax=Sporothrix schenckii 1099-18 TaxID=1397361 RepID=A0A0F2MBW7_SPOSC|nr:uncharacterized protein SPSK_02892 [Sporothrix schenckii 1099-18]KJR86559.1 hypothetical protein SPSK_02892 [Sporothrix schenckii 1099-18]
MEVSSVFGGKREGGASEAERHGRHEQQGDGVELDGFGNCPLADLRCGGKPGKKRKEKQQVQRQERKEKKEGL